MFATRAVRVFAYGSPVDMRKGFEGLSALVRLGMNHDPLSGDLYLFVNRHRKRAKVLLWDGTGLCLYAKRLERGRFASLWKSAGAAALSLTITELQLFLEGSALVGKIALTPPPLSRKDLAIAVSTL
jgi:transposase